MVGLSSEYPLVTERQQRVFSLLARKGAVEILNVLLAQPRRHFSLRELGEEAGVPTMSASRIVSDLHDMGVVRRRVAGRAHATSLHRESPATEFVKRLFEACAYK